MRIVLEVLVSPARDPQSWRVIAEQLRGQGVTLLDEPGGDSPQALRALVAPEVASDAVLDALRETDGIGRVEVDSLREIM